MSIQDRLVAFVVQKLHDAEKELPGELGADTSLIKSGLVDSLTLLHLAAWIEEEMRDEIDLSEVDFQEEWDTVALITRFIENAQPSSD